MESTTSAKLNWREIYAGILVLLIGLFFLFLMVSSKLSSRASSYVVEVTAGHYFFADAIHPEKNEGG